MIVLALLLQSAACPPGVYAMAADGTAAPLTETRASHRKVAGLAGAMLLGPFGGNRMKVKSVVDGASAATRVRPGRPEFRFCFAPAAAPSAGQGDYIGVGAPATGPGEYHLVRFDARTTQRELELSTIGGFGGPRGTLSQSVTPFRAEQLSPGVWRIVPERDLPMGEYGFMQPPPAAASARKKDAVERVYDFSVGD